MEGHICSIPGCTNILNKTSGKICQMHRSRFHRHGSYEISPNWTLLKKGKPHPNNNGYLRVHIGNKRVLLHRHIMEQHIGRPLTRSETVHHKNGIRTDNRIENLELHSSHSEHMKCEHRYSWRNRTVSPPYTQEQIDQILSRVHKPFGAFSECFCGLPVEARNMCSRHYQWAYKHLLK